MGEYTHIKEMRCYKLIEKVINCLRISGRSTKTTFGETWNDLKKIWPFTYLTADVLECQDALKTQCNF